MFTQRVSYDFPETFVGFPGSLTCFPFGVSCVFPGVFYVFPGSFVCFRGESCMLSLGVFHAASFVCVRRKFRMFSQEFRTFT